MIIKLAISDISGVTHVYYFHRRWLILSDCVEDLKQYSNYYMSVISTLKENYSTISNRTDRSVPKVSLQSSHNLSSCLIYSSCN